MISIGLLLIRMLRDYFKSRPQLEAEIVILRHQLNLIQRRAPHLRFALPNSRIMLHQPSGGFQGQATDIMLHAQEILNLKKRLNEIYVKHTGQPLKKIEDALERDYFLTGEMAVEWGVVDKVIAKRPEDVSKM